MKKEKPLKYYMQVRLVWIFSKKGDEISIFLDDTGWFKLDMQFAKDTGRCLVDCETVEEVLDRIQTTFFDDRLVASIRRDILSVCENGKHIDAMRNAINRENMETIRRSVLTDKKRRKPLPKVKK